MLYFPLIFIQGFLVDFRDHIGLQLFAIMGKVVWDQLKVRGKSEKGGRERNSIFY